MSDPLELRSELEAALGLASAEAQDYLRDIGTEPVLDHASAEALADWSPQLPEAGSGLNVPYDCGFAFVREPERLARALSFGAPYLPSADDPRPGPGFFTPENSRRARALAVWATLRAYGREGHRAMVERHLSLARHLAARVDEAPDFERLADVQLNIVCFRVSPAGVAEDRLDDLNRELGEALLRDGRVFAGTTVYDGKVAFRPAIVNWQTQQADVDLLMDVLIELVGARG